MPVCELNSSGSVLASNNWGPDGLISRTAGSATSFYDFDEQGNTTAIYNSSMSVVDQYEYDAYGNQVGGSSSVFAYDGFGSKYGNYHDPAMGWMLMGHRFYAPNQARFINRDPIGYWGGFNLYEYAGNNPINEIDPLGLWSFYRWLYTGDGNASDCIYFAALDAAGESLPTRAPDYVTFNVGKYFNVIPWTPWMRLGAKGSIGPGGNPLSITLSKSGHIFFTPNAGGLGTTGGSVGVSAGYIDNNTDTPPSPSDVDSFIANRGWNYSASWGLGVGQTWSTMGTASTMYRSNEFGISGIGAGVGFGYGFPTRFSGPSW